MRWGMLITFLMLVASGGPAVAECREYSTTALIEGRQQRLTGTACRQPDGTWRMMSSRPAPADHDRARAAVAAGEALPLSDVLARLRPRYPGRLLDVELYEQGGRWRYRLKLMRPDNQVQLLTVDGLSAEVLAVRGGG